MADSPWRETAGRAIAVLLDWGCRARYEIKVRGLQGFTRSPSTIVVFNHRRDADTPIIANILFGRRGVFAHDITPIFVAREDLFRDGFLGHYLMDWPSPARDLLGRINLRPFLWGLRAYPMRRIAERTLGETLENVRRLFGDLPLEDVLRAEWVERFGQMALPAARPRMLGELLDGRFESLLSVGYGLTKLNRRRFRELKPFERETIGSQLRLFVEMLDRGELLQWAPEGAVSRDGGFARLRAGLHVLLSRCTAPVRVLPVGITYDFMTSGRQWVFVNVGPEILDLKGLKRSEVSKRVPQAILAQSTITASQLASQLVVTIRARGGGVLRAEQLLEHVSGEARRWAEEGLYVDPRLLSRQDLEQRVKEYVRYCERSGDLIPWKNGQLRVQPQNGEPVVCSADPRGALQYTWNELVTLTRLCRGYRRGSMDGFSRGSASGTANAVA